MSQRLIIEIHNGKDILACGYYHWAGTTLKALEHINTIIEYFNNNIHLSKESIYQIYQRAFAALALHSTGASVSKESGKELSLKLQNLCSEKFNKTSGIIYLTDSEILCAYAFDSMFISLNFKDKTVDCFNLFQEFKNKKELSKVIRKENKITLPEEDFLKKYLNKLIINDLVLFDLKRIKFDQFKQFSETIINFQNNIFRYKSNYLKIIK